MRRSNIVGAASFMLSTVLLGCTTETDIHQAAQANDTLEPETASVVMPQQTATPTVLKPEQLTSVCKAAFANMFGHSPKIMKATSKEVEIVRVSYHRPDDRKLFTNDCRVEGNRIIWRSVDAFPGDGPGRWRTSSDDDVLSFVIDGKKVTITTTYSDGSSAAETVPLI